MGLFFSEAGAKVRGTKKPAGAKSARIQLHLQQNLDCSHCPRDKAALQSPKMEPYGSNRPLVYILGEAPSKVDDSAGRMFSGSSGEMIRDALPKGWDKHVRWNSTLRCAGGAPELLDTACCRRLQEKDIAATKPLAVIAFGDALHWALDGSCGMPAWRGRRVPRNIGGHQCWVYPVMHPVQLQYNKDKRKDEALRVCFQRDIERVFLHVVAMQAGDMPLATVEDPASYYDGIEVLEDYGTAGLRRVEDRLAFFNDEEQALDIETNRLSPYFPDSRILSMSVGNYLNTFAFGIDHPQAKWSLRHRKLLDDLIKDYLLQSKRKWAHRAKFEQEWLHAKYGPEVIMKTEWGDTLGQAHILDERAAKELNDLTLIHFGFRVKALSTVDVENLANEPLKDVLLYNGLDVKYTHAASQVQADELDAQGLTHVYDEANAATPALVRMQAKGLVRNMPAIKVLDAQFEKLEQQHEKDILKHPDAVSFAQSQGKPFNPASNPQLAALFRDHLKLPHPLGKRGTGKNGEKYSVDEDTLLKLRHPIAKLIMKKRSSSKLRDYVTPLLPGGKWVHGDGLVHPQYLQFITVTGRLQSNDPNAQNFPRRKNKEVRRVIGCPPGHVMGAFDFAQLEARIIACITNDTVLKQEIRNKQDIHGDWTDAIGAEFVPKMLADDRKALRDAIKQYWTFANFYGNELGGLAYDLSTELQVNISPRALQPFYDEFWRKYAITKAWQEQLLENYWTKGYVETATGQRRREPMNRNELINMPIQGTAGKMVLDAQVRLSRIAYEQDIEALQPIMNVHDDLTFYLPADGVEELVPFISEQMVCTPYDFIDVPLGVEVKLSKGGEFGHNWADVEEKFVFTTLDFQQ